ncbi:MAG: uracil-DNA glycosylase, partial [Rhizobiales bacterium]|nr:uracil-DNA glycosylase [Hyphomicrobiales bacterium]
MAQGFDPNCRDCPRLATFLDEVRERYPDYHCAPVAPFGATRARLLIVGLAPGMHGANASGRPFTGDHAGILLYETLYRYGFSSRETSQHRRDGLRLIDCRMTNAVKCLPPQNKPVGAEIATCNRFLAAELAALPRGALVLALGGIAHRAVLRALGMKQSALKFAHHAKFNLENGLTLMSSYHCSRYNTQTRRLT